MKLIPNSVSRSVSMNVLKAKKNSPHIFFAAGVVGTVASTVLACRATLKLEPVLDEIRDDIKSNKEKKGVAGYSDQEYTNSMLRTYVKAGKDLGKLYGPAILIGTASIAALSGSHVQLTRRNSALTATAASLAQAFESYRERVREEMGEEKELDIYRGVRDETVTIDGKEQAIKVLEGGPWSPYARIFDEFNSNWTKDPTLNLYYIKCQQEYANHKLNSRGHVLLNDVYDLLGFERTPAGAVVGWLRNSEGDNFVDFGLYEAYNAPFVEGEERSVILDFNVDGIIYDQL